MNPKSQVLTVGHSNSPFERLRELLTMHGVTAVADVRSQPYSRINPHFNRENLAQALKSCGVRYVFLGEELGARVSNPSCYRDGKVQYDLVAKTEDFRRGINRVLKGASRYRLALMCAEREPLACHRSILVGRYLHELNVQVQHILGDGRLENHNDSIARLICSLKVGEADLFKTREEIISAAYAAQAERIAYSRDYAAKSA